MRKRILSLLLTMALVAMMIVVPTYAAEAPVENTTAVTDTCPCGCGKTLAQLTWQPWDTSYGSPSNGHYYLDGDYAQSGQVTIMSGEKVVLDLRGNTLTTTKGARIALVYGYMAVLDTVGGGMISNITTGGANGGSFMVAVNETEASTFEMLSGTIAPQLGGGTTTGVAGGVFSIGNGCRFIMHDGIIMNASASGNGGAIVASSGSDIQILGGTIMGCTSGNNGGTIYSKDGKVTLKNCKILGGTAAGNGGNIYLEGTNLTGENVTIAHGVSKTQSSHGGGNICVISSSYYYGKLTFTDSAILDGYCMNKGGNVSMASGVYKFTNTKILGGMAEKSNANIYSSKKFDNVTLTNCTLPKDLVEACPHCDQAVSWFTYGSTVDTHWYLSADDAAFAGLTVKAGETIVLDLAGYDLTCAGRAFTVENGGSLTILDSVGGGKVIGSGVDGEAGGVIYNAGTLNLYGGKYIYAKNENITVVGGGVVCNDDTFGLHGAILDGSAYENTDTTSFGGALYQTNATAADMNYFTMTGGRIIGGRAYQGGSMYIGHYGDATITAGTVLGGSAWEIGGNIYCYGGPYNSDYKFRIANCAVLGGALDSGNTVDGFGGNVYVARYEMTLDNCYIRGGKIDNCKSGYGGNLESGSVGVIKATGTILEGGYSETAGGNYYSSNSKSDATFTDCLILNGKTGGSGGNLRPSNGTMTVKGGVIAYGEAGTSGGNIYHNSSTVLKLVADSAGNPVQLLRGTAKENGGNLCTTQSVELTAAYFSGGSASGSGDDIYKSGTGTFTVGAGLTGDIKLGLSSTAITAPGYGNPVLGSACTELNAAITLDETYNNAKLLVKDGKLYVGVAMVVGDTEVWYATNEEAVAACDEGSYIKLYTANDLTLTKDLFVDLNGNAVTVSGDYAFYGMDASGDDYTEPTGSATGVSAATCDLITAPNGKLYVAVAESDTVSYHCLGMKITGVNIRPSVDGMYYTAKWSCDDTVKGLIASYGVVTSTANMPGADFVNDGDNLWTTFTQDSFVSGQTQNGAVITGILKTEDRTEAQNSDYGKKPVYAKPYIQFTNGTTCVSSDNIRYSLYDVMKGLDTLIYEKPIQYRPYTLALRDFYNTWKENGMGSWKFDRIPEPEDDGVIDVLMIGSSFCYYYVEELYALAEAAGIPMRVCNAYYSGCQMVWHYEWWQAGESNYQFYVTDGSGRRQTNNGSLEWCLAQDDWDVISIQESGIYRNCFVKDPTNLEDRLEAYLADNGKYADALIPYLQEQFPNADIYWHQTWANQVGYTHSKYNVTAENASVVQPAMTNAEKTVAMHMVETYGIQRIPSGEAWQIMRNTHGYDSLCARLGNNGGVGDYYHDGDIGGGQYLNACVWFEMITGKSVLDNTYKPDYKTSSTLSSSLLATLDVEKTATGYALSDELIALLKQAAHDTVASMGITVE